MHFLSVAAALTGSAFLVSWSLFGSPRGHPGPILIYSFGLIASFSLSAAYNMTHHARIRALLRRFDHAAIFVMIAGTYTPIALIGIGGDIGWFLVLAAWSIAGLGIILKLFFFHKAYRAVFFLYLLQGWLAIIVIGPMVRDLSLPVLILVAVGGLIYTFGTIIHHRENWAYNRAIWHSFVLAAAAVHFVAVFELAKTA